MPPSLRGCAEITAVELDPVSARIAQHIHPDITLYGGVGFEAVDLPTNWFDLVGGLMNGRHKAQINI